MAFLKIDTMGMNARYGRTKVAPEKALQVTEFNTPNKNRAPYIPKTEAKEGDVLSFFDDGKGKVLTSFDGGYEAGGSLRIEDKPRVEGNLNVRGRLIVNGDMYPGESKKYSLGASIGINADHRRVSWKDLYMARDIWIMAEATQSLVSIYASNDQAGENPPFANDGGTLNLEIAADRNIAIEAGSGGETADNGSRASGNIQLEFGDAATRNRIDIEGTSSPRIKPYAAGTYDIGTATNYFNDLYIKGNITGKSGDMTISAAGGDISFDNENLATTGTLASGALTVTGTMSASSTMTAGTVLSVTGAGATDAACIQIANQADLGIWKPAANTIGFTTDDEDAYRMDTVAFYAGTDDSFDLGKSGARFDDVYATNGTIQTSDSRLKESISDSALGLSFLNELRPVQFKFKDKARRHYGLVAQEVEQVLSDSGISTTDFAPLIHDGDSDRYGMRYSEFTSILIKAVQELSKEIEELKK